MWGDCVEEKAETPEAPPEDYNIKKELKDEAKFFGKGVLRGIISTGAQALRGGLNVLRKHPKVEQLEEDVEEHIKEIEEQEKDE